MKKLKIMMVTMGLGIGGAETHIVELAKELKRQGQDVSVCSNGGQYVEPLTKADIRHYDMPLNERSLKLMASSFFRLLRAMRAERPDVVHAHARIPALISSIACSLLHIPLVTTVHFNFKVTPALRLMTRWGKYTLAVSQDLKNYVVENYHIREENVSVTINGFDTQNFSPDTDYSGLREELQIAPDKRVILYISRMDHNACAAAFRLLDCAGEVRTAHPDTVMVVVGNGDAYEEIRDRAEALNQKLGERYVIVTGGRTDINRCCAMAEVFVGVSRAAMEAMASEKPVILAGNQGYLGLFTKDKLPDCIKTNFTCRDIPYPSDDILCKELCAVLDRPEGLEEIKRYGRQVIKEFYSVSRMAKDALEAYQAVLTKKRYDFLLCGYYGYNNIGDEYALKAIIRNLNTLRPDVRLCVLTNHPDTVSKSLGVRCADRFKLREVLSSIRKSRVMIFGGGNLLQDGTSSKSLWYYLMLLHWAKRKGLPTMIYANGIGPIKKKFDLKITRKVLLGIDVITLREGDSYELVRSMGIPEERVSVTADEAFSIALDPSNCDLEERYGLKEGSYVVVSIRESAYCEEHFCGKLAAALDEIARKHNSTTVFMQMQYPYDYEISRVVAGMMKMPTKILSDLTFNDFSCLLSSSMMVVGMRLHSLILGVLAGAAVYGLVYDAKVESFLHAADLQCFSDCAHLDEQKLVQDLEAVLENAEELKRRLAAFVETQRASAARNSREAVRLLEETL